MKNLLIPVDADHPERTREAVQEAARTHAAEDVTVHLLSVQPAVNGHVALCFGAGELRALQEQAAQEELREPSGWLQAAGVPFTTRMQVGRRAPAIAETARVLGCHRILFGNPAAHGDGLFGSIAGQVRHLLAGTPSCEVIGS